ncbi:MAG: argininosuccinate lyase [Actinomycetota bacterium]
MRVLWGGRFRRSPADDLWNFTVDRADQRLLEFDIQGSIGHVAMLAEVGLLTEAERFELHKGLEQILDEARNDQFLFLPSDEDVHSAVERRLVDLTGEVGEKLHTGRSRNDQIAVDVQMYLRAATAERAADLGRYVLVLADLAEEHAETVVSSYTHMQQAQVTSLGHHFLAYAWMALRDRGRFADLLIRHGSSPLGAGAASGSSLPIDPGVTARLLGFERPFDNSIDAVASRDLVAEFVFCCAQAMVSLSRLAEELVLWSTTEFGWVTFDDAYTTGSSALPHKKNPDIAELVRGRAAAVIGDLSTVLVLQKGLPLAYNRDLQEDKPPLFRADDTLSAALAALSGMLRSGEFNPPSPASWTAGLDLAELLVERGVPFRRAHQAVGRLVLALTGRGETLADATTADLTGVDPNFRAEDLSLIDPAVSLARRRSPGSGSPQSVLVQVAALRDRVAGAR